MGAHLIDGDFQSDKYPSCPLGKVPLSTQDPTAQDLLWIYAQRRRKVDSEFSDDLEQALINHGYLPPPQERYSIIPWNHPSRGLDEPPSSRRPGVD